MDKTIAKPGGAPADRFVRGALTWHLYLLIGFFQLFDRQHAGQHLSVPEGRVRRHTNPH